MLGLYLRGVQSSGKRGGPGNTALDQIRLYHDAANGISVSGAPPRWNSSHRQVWEKRCPVSNKGNRKGGSGAKKIHLPRFLRIEKRPAPEERGVCMGGNASVNKLEGKTGAAMENTSS